MKQTGFSLIELLVVLVIIGLLGAVVGPQVLQYVGGAKSDTARMQVADLGAALDLFYLDNGRYPHTREGLQALVSSPPGLKNWGGPYLKKKTVPQDPWGRDYQYAAPGRNGAYDLFSYGADNAPGGDKENADVTSWE